MEYKFSCPHCGQHIVADDSIAGSEIVCPTCRDQFIAPSLVVPTGEIVPSATVPEAVAPTIPTLSIAARTACYCGTIVMFFVSLYLSGLATVVTPMIFVYLAAWAAWFVTFLLGNLSSRRGEWRPFLMTCATNGIVAAGVVYMLASGRLLSLVFGLLYFGYRSRKAVSKSTPKTKSAA